MPDKTMSGGTTATEIGGSGRITTWMLIGPSMEFDIYNDVGTANPGIGTGAM